MIQNIPTAESSSSTSIMPAEWAEHRATWIGWPYLESDYPTKVDAVRWAYTEFIKILSQFETVEILCATEELEADARSRLSRQKIRGDFRFHRVPYNRTWLRDSAPILVKTPTPAWVRFGFTGWGALGNTELDQRIPEEIARITGYPLVTAKSDGGKPVILEGGALEVNGNGLIMVTEQCLLSTVQPRNPGFAKGDYESVFRNYLGADTTIWLGEGIEGDDTHGHIDNLARFIGERTVLIGNYDKSDPSRYEHSQKNVDILRQFRMKDGTSLEVIELPFPRDRHCDNDHFGCSYLNFYLANGVVLVPTFNDILDRKILNLFQDLFQGREVRGIYCGDWIHGGGALHCSTQQEPRI